MSQSLQSTQFELPQKPYFWQVKKRKIWNDQMSIIRTAQVLLGTPDLEFRSQIAILTKAKEMYDEITQ